MAKVGLVTVLYKSDDVLEDFFKSLSMQTFKDYHLYLIDNSPSIKSTALIHTLVEKYPVSGYTHIENSQNIGVAKGNNQGIELSLKNGADYILLLNNDIDFPQSFLFQAMMDSAENKNEDIIIPKIFYYGTRKIWMAGGKTLKYLGYSTHIGVDKEDASDFNKEAYFDYAPTCFMLISKKVFDKIGLMDEKYFVYYDDSDFLIRAYNQGFKVFYMPSLEVFHKVSSSTGGGTSLFSIYYLNRNRIYFIKKNLSFPTKQIAYVYSLLTRAGWYVKYKKDERKQLLKAVIDGFKL